jgi:hypothetical protein
MFCQFGVLLRKPFDLHLFELIISGMCCSYVLDELVFFLVCSLMSERELGLEIFYFLLFEF